MIGWAIVGAIKQARCEHVNATGFTNDLNGTVSVVCNKCGKISRLVMSNDMEAVFELWNRKIKVTRVVDEETNTLKMSVKTIERF